MFEIILLLAFMILLSIIFITLGSDWATDSLIPLAQKLGTTHVAIGLTLVSIMVSLPEIIIAVWAAKLGHINISLGVIIGSIICNIGLMTGLSAMIKPLKVSRSLILRDSIFALCVAIVVLVLSTDQQITQSEGWAFILIFIPYLINVWVQEKSKHEAQKEKELKEVEIELDFIGLQFGKIKAGILSFMFGMVLLLIGSYLFSKSLTWISGAFGFSDLLIGLTIGAIGPSIPNIAAAIQATLKNMEEVAVSETLGSNIFTLLVTLGILSIIQPITITAGWLRFDIPIMVAMSILLLTFMVYRQRISRAEGWILFLSYIAVLIMNIFIHM